MDFQMYLWLANALLIIYHNAAKIYHNTYYARIRCAGFLLDLMCCFNVLEWAIEPLQFRRIRRKIKSKKRFKQARFFYPAVQAISASGSPKKFRAFSSVGRQAFIQAVSQALTIRVYSDGFPGVEYSRLFGLFLKHWQFAFIQMYSWGLIFLVHRAIGFILFFNYNSGSQEVDWEF